MLHRSWTFLGDGGITDYRVFRLRRDRYRFEPTGEERDFAVIDSASWVNVVPVTTEGNVVLIRQFRHGIRDVVLEIPGGMIDGDEAPAAAAARELREETGYVAQNIRLLARVLPNPAVQNNYLYLFAAEGCRNTGQTQPDAFELIEVLERPLADIPDLIANGEIAHSMVIAAFAFMGLVKPTPKEYIKMTTSSTMLTRKCPACGSEKIIPNTYLSGVDQVLFAGNPAAFMLKERRWGKCVGEMCGDCGVITLRAEEPTKMWEAYQQTVQGGRTPR